MINTTIRAEKTTQNKDDVRVLLAGVILCITMIFGQATYQSIYDMYFAKRPFITATTLEIVHVDEELQPLIRYDADPNQNVRGTWIASVYSVEDVRLNTRRGQGNYLVGEDAAKYWSWTAFFDNEESDPPPVPMGKFYVCVRYDVEASDSGVNDSTDRVCSNVYDPANPTLVLGEYIYGDVIQ